MKILDNLSILLIMTIMTILAIQTPCQNFQNYPDIYVWTVVKQKEDFIVHVFMFYSSCYGDTTAHFYSYSVNQKGLALNKLFLILKGPVIQSCMRHIVIIEDHDVPMIF